MDDRSLLEEWLDEIGVPRSMDGMALSLKGRVMDLMERNGDSQYVAGMKHGWNCAVSDDRAAYDSALRARGK